jgi:hypothetical protein
MGSSSLTPLLTISESAGRWFSRRVITLDRLDGEIGNVVLLNQLESAKGAMRMKLEWMNGGDEAEPAKEEAGSEKRNGLVMEMGRFADTAAAWRMWTSEVASCYALKLPVHTCTVCRKIHMRRRELEMVALADMGGMV